MTESSVKVMVRKDDGYGMAATSTLEADILGVIIAFVMPGLFNNDNHNDASHDNINVESLARIRAAAAVAVAAASASAAECRCVSRNWRGAVDEAINRSLPPISSASLAFMLGNNRLRSIMIQCRYISRENDDDSVHVSSLAVLGYDNLVARAEVCAAQLRRAIAAVPLEQWKETSRRKGGAGETAKREGCSNSTDNAESGVSAQCCRVALARIVGQALRNPVFAWCSTLQADDARLLEGCVGAAALLKARWFGR